MTSSKVSGRLLSLFAAGPPAYDVTRIFLVSAGLAFFFLFCGSFWIESGAASYQDWANALVHGGNLKNDAALQWRDIGYALVLIAGGFPFTNSFLGTVVIQTLMGISMPVLVYFTLRPWFPRAAYYTAIAFAFSLAPFLMIKMIHHDQPYIFFTVLSLCLYNQYISSKRPAYVYALTFAMFGVALHRMLGRYFYALLLGTAALQRRTNFKHYVAGFLIFAVGLGAYLTYRAVSLGHPPSNLGRQVFQNMYLTSVDFGQPLTADIGPYTRLVMQHVYKQLLPSPVEAPALKNGPSSPEFMKAHVYAYTADELYKKIFHEPCFDYMLIVDGANSDKLLLKASIEIARARPLFILEYTLRNLWNLLYQPGWGHGRFTTIGYRRDWVTFPMGGTAGRSIGDTISDRAPRRALKELSFIPLVRQPALVQGIYFFVVKLWAATYFPLAKIFFCLMALTWISTIIGLLARLLRWPKLRHWSRLWQSDQVIDSSLGISLLFFANVGITAVLVDPLLRYDFSLLPIKIMLSGIGVAILLRLLHRLEEPISFRYADDPQWPHGLFARVFGYESSSAGARSAKAIVPRWYWLLTGPIFAVLLAVGFSSWSRQVDKFALRIPGEHTIHVKSAGCPRWENGHALPLVRSVCSGEQRCSYVFDKRDFVDKDCRGGFRIEWTCTKDGPLHNVSSSPGPKSGTRIQLSCE